MGNWLVMIVALLAARSSMISSRCSCDHGQWCRVGVSSRESDVGFPLNQNLEQEASAAGLALQRLPPRLARPWIAMPPTTEAASARQGYCL